MPERHLDLQHHRDRVIARNDLFQILDADALGRLADTAHERQVSAGTILVDEGDTGRSLFIVLEGFLEVSVADDQAGRLVVNRLAAGAFFGEFSLLTGAPRSARVTAKTDCVLIEITEAILTPILQSCPGLADHLACVLASRQQMTREARDGRGTNLAQTKKDEARFLTRIRTLFGI